MDAGNRYANDWNAYSRDWESRHGSNHEYLGDEWGNAKRDDWYFGMYADRFLKPGMTVLEVGPGGGKWTVRIAPRVEKLIVLDVAEEMLKRTRERCQSADIHNVEYILGNGEDFRPVPDESVSFFFSYDVFVHIALEDTWPYAHEIARVLKPYGRGICHHAVNSTPQAWDRIEQYNDWYRFGRHTQGQYYYHSPLALQRMYERCGLRIAEQRIEYASCTCVFTKPGDSIVPRLERLLKQLGSAETDDERVRGAVVTELQALPQHLEILLEGVLEKAGAEPKQFDRVRYAEVIRGIWRGC